MDKYQFADTRILPERIDALGNEESLKISVVPWIAGRIFWDFVDSVINLAKAEGYSDLKPCSRRLRELFAQFDFKRRKYINERLQTLEAEKAEEIQEKYAEDFSEPYQQMREHIANYYPKISKDTAEFLASVYMSLAVGDALARYCYGVDRKISSLLGVMGNASIYPPEICHAKKILLMYLGDHDQALRSSDIAAVSQRIYEVVCSLSLESFPETEFTKPQKIVRNSRTLNKLTSNKP